MLIGFAVACGAETTKEVGIRRGGPNPAAPAAGSGATDPAPTGAAGSPFSGTRPGVVPGGGLIIDSGVLTDSATGCVGTMVTAPPPANPKVDIIWVVDASGSMLDEQIKIGANMTQFAEAIAQANLDIRIVMMTTSAAIPVICPVVDPDPLAASPLKGDPRYRFIDSRVDSQNSLEILLGNFPTYSDFLRPDAATHVVVVSDDESIYQGLATPEERAQAFYADMKTQLNKDFILHSIASEGPTPCSDPMCMPDVNTGICVFVMLGCGASAPGATYYSLSNMTQGLTASICQSDWKTIFEPLTAAVIESAPLPCNYTIPPPPAGEQLDPMKVNVGYLAPGQPAEELFPRANDSAACGDSNGWYYDDAATPSEVLLCPNTCQHVAAGGTLNLTFGCETIILL